MLKKWAAALLLPAIAAAASAQTTGFGADSIFAKGLAGFEVNLDMDVIAFQYEKNEKSDADQRIYAGDYKPELITWPFGGREGEYAGRNFAGDSNLYITYTGAKFGGTFGISVEEKYMAKVGTLKAWLQPLGWLKISGGIDMDADYIDNLDADPGMRIYNGDTQADWAAYRNPDNITQNQGIMLESFLGPATLAFAGRYYEPTVHAIDINGAANNHTEWVYVNEARYSYGARAAWRFGDRAKVNASWLIEYSNYGDKQQNFYNIDRDGNVVPTVATAETARHLFGLYGSVYPLSALGISLGYNGIATKYCDEFYNLGTYTWDNTAMPLVYKQAVNLNMRYKAGPWTIRTDNVLNFWTDKNYQIFGISNRNNKIEDMGIVAESQAGDYADVNHLLLWNGLGAGYQFTPTIKAELYARNLYRVDNAADTGPQRQTYQFNRNMLSVELKGIWKPNEYVEAYISLLLEDTMTAISKDIHEQNRDPPYSGFKPGVDSADTLDTQMVFKVPIGVTIKMK
jgi:hypothetical protein